MNDFSENEKKLKELVERLHFAKKNDDSRGESEAYFKIGKFYYELNDLNKSKLNFENVYNLNKKYPRLNYYLGLISIKEGNLEDAIYYFDKEYKYTKFKKAKEIRDKIVINNNFPYGTILISIIITITYFIFGDLNTLTLFKYGLSSKNINFFNLITSTFIHVNFVHYFINQIALLTFGFFLEKEIGTYKFLSIFLASAIFGNFIEVSLVKNSFVVGISGGLFGLLGALMMKRPLLNLNLLFLFKVPIMILFGAYFLLEQLIFSYLIKGMIIGQYSHLFGFFLGIFMLGLFYNENINIFYYWIIIFFSFNFINKFLENIVKTNNTLIIFLYSLGTISLSAIIYYTYRLLKKFRFEELTNIEEVKNE